LPASATDEEAGMNRRPTWINLAVMGLIVMITWTVVVKYLAPILWFWSETAAGRVPAAVPVMWDFWPLAHALLAILLWRCSEPLGLRTWSLAMSVAAVETTIVVAKLSAWGAQPDRSFWKLLWLTNKVYVLLFFLWLLALLVSPGRRPVRAPPQPGGRAEV
jgi:hypothetical protein